MPLARLLRATAGDEIRVPPPAPLAAEADPGDGLLASLFDWSFRDELDTDWGRARRTGLSATAS
ncbi:MAG: hypothetical protein U1A78_00825 [Polyangia bacterium]